MFLVILVVMTIIAAVYLFYGVVPTLSERMEYRRQRAMRNVLLPGRGKRLYLTFDDGPSKKYTEKLLDLLLKYNIHATFFVVADFAEENPKLIERMKKEGHLIGLHSLSHQSACLQTPYKIRENFFIDMETMRELGVQISYYRPPWGEVNREILSCIKDYRMKMVLWDVTAEDWEKNTLTEEILYKLLTKTKNNQIINLHDGSAKIENAPAKMITALESAIPIWLAEGYRFATIDDLDRAESGNPGGMENVI